MNLFSAVTKEYERMQLQGIVDELTRKISRNVAEYDFEGKSEGLDPREIFNQWERCAKETYDMKAGSDSVDEGCNINVRRRILMRNIDDQRKLFFRKLADSGHIFEWCSNEEQSGAVDSAAPGEEVSDMPEPILLQDDVITELSSLLILPEDSGDSLLKEIIFEADRRCIKHGNLYIQAKLAERSFYLLNEYLLVVSVQDDGRLLLEETISLRSCQIKCEDYHGLLDKTTLVTGNDLNILELMWLQGSMTISFKNDDEKNAWASAIFAGICDTVSDVDRRIGWRHHIRLGTIHSAIVTRDMALLDAYKERCESGALDYSIFDQQDDEGFTPIHYACIFRITYIVQFLLETGVDVTAKDSQGSTALHWASLLLDNENLSALCANIFDTDLFDERGHTPLFLVCIAGRDSSGAINYDRVVHCMTSLISLGADVNIKNAVGYSLLQYAVSRWQAPIVEVLLKADADIFCGKDGDSDLLHLLCQCRPLDSNIFFNRSCLPYVSDTASIEKTCSLDIAEEELSSSDALQIATALIRAGLPVNSKNLDGLTILDLIAKSYVQFGDDLPAMLQLFISNGARPEESSSLIALRGQFRFVNSAVQSGIEHWNSKGILGSEGIDINDAKFDRSARASKEMSSSCRSCGFAFTLFKRKQICSFCKLGCCDLCARKKIEVKDDQLKCCDGCYNKMTRLCELESQRLFMLGKLNDLPTMDRCRSDLTNKKDLLRGAQEKSDQPTSLTDAIMKTTGMSALMSTLGEAKEQLHARGEKLEQLSDKTSKLASNAEKFAELAKQLNKEKSSWW